MMQHPDRHHDWTDCHTGPVAPRHDTARAAFEAGFAAMPGWVDTALRMRDGVVKRFGLTTVTEGAVSMTNLPVLEDSPTRYEVGLEDKHLTFTILTERHPSKVSVTTRIWFNHWLGRVYLGVVVIPHKIIVRHAIRALA